MKCYIYKIINTITNEKYVGQTTNFSRRISDHKQKLNANTHVNPKLQASWNKYGEQAFKITKEELYNGINALYKSSTLKADIDQIFKNLDMDNDGYIGYEEFVRGAVNKEYFIQPNILKFAFRYFDKDDSGEITLDEIKDL